MGVDISSGQEPIGVSEAELSETAERCLLSFGFNCQVMNLLGQKSPPEGLRLVLAASSLDLAFEHHSAIARFSHLGYYGSANALIRPLMEAVIAGLWLAYCATGHQAKLLDEGRLTTDMNAMLRQLSKKLGKRMQRLRDVMLDEVGKVFHGFTHGGMEQLRWRTPYAGRGNNHGHPQIVGSLLIADVAMVNAVDAAGLIYNDEEVRRLAGKYIDQVVFDASAMFSMPVDEAHWEPLPDLPS